MRLCHAGVWPKNFIFLGLGASGEMIIVGEPVFEVPQILRRLGSLG